MTDTTYTSPDLDRLLRLLALLPPLTDRSWTELGWDGDYVQGKMSSAVVDVVRADVPRRVDANYLARYVLLYFGAGSNGAVTHEGVMDFLAGALTETGGHQGASEWLRDARAAAWNVYVDTKASYITTDDMERRYSIT